MIGRSKYILSANVNYDPTDPDYDGGAVDVMYAAGGNGYGGQYLPDTWLEGDLFVVSVINNSYDFDDIDI